MSWPASDSESLRSVLTLAGAFHTLTVAAGRVARTQGGGRDLMRYHENSAPDSGLEIVSFPPDDNVNGLRVDVEPLAVPSSLSDLNGFPSGASSAWRVIFSAGQLARSGLRQEVRLSLRAFGKLFADSIRRLTVEVPSSAQTGLRRLSFNSHYFSAVGATVFSDSGATLVYHGHRRGLDVLRGPTETDSEVNHCDSDSGWRRATYVEVAGLGRDGRYVRAGDFADGTLTMPGLQAGDEFRLLNYDLGGDHANSIPQSPILPSGVYAAEFLGMDDAGNVSRMNVRSSDLSGVRVASAHELCARPASEDYPPAPVPVSLAFLLDGAEVDGAFRPANPKSRELMILTVEARGLTRSGVAATAQRLLVSLHRSGSEHLLAEAEADGGLTRVAYRIASSSDLGRAQGGSESLSSEMEVRPLSGRGRRFVAEFQSARQVLFHGAAVFALSGRETVLPRVVGPDGATMNVTMFYHRARGGDYFISRRAFADGWQDAVCADPSGELRHRELRGDDARNNVRAWRIPSLAEALALGSGDGRVGALNGESVPGLASGLAVSLAAGEGDSPSAAGVLGAGVWADVYAAGRRDGLGHRAVNPIRPGSSSAHAACVIRADGVPENPFGLRAEDAAGREIQAANVVLPSRTSASIGIKVLTVTVRKWRYGRNGIALAERVAVAATLDLPSEISGGLRSVRPSQVEISDLKVLATTFAASYRYHSADGEAPFDSSSSGVMTLLLNVGPAHAAAFNGSALSPGAAAELRNVANSMGRSAANIRMVYHGVRGGLQILHSPSRYPDGYQEDACGRGAAEGWRLPTVDDSLLVGRALSGTVSFDIMHPDGIVRTYDWSGEGRGSVDDASPLTDDFYLDVYHPVAITIAGVGLRHPAQTGPHSRLSGGDAGILCVRRADGSSEVPPSPSAQRFVGSGTDAISISVTWRRSDSLAYDERYDPGEGRYDGVLDSHPLFHVTLEAWRHLRAGAAAESSGALGAGGFYYQPGRRCCQFYADHVASESGGARSVFEVRNHRIDFNASGAEWKRFRARSRFGSAEQALTVTLHFTPLTSFGGVTFYFRGDERPEDLVRFSQEDRRLSFQTYYLGRYRGLHYVRGFRSDGAPRDHFRLQNQFCAAGGLGWRMPTLGEVLALQLPSSDGSSALVLERHDLGPAEHRSDGSDAPGFQDILRIPLPPRHPDDDRSSRGNFIGNAVAANVWLPSRPDGLSRLLAVRQVFGREGSFLSGIGSADDAVPTYLCVRAADDSYVRQPDLVATRFGYGGLHASASAATLRVNRQGEYLSPRSFSITAEAWRYDVGGLATADSDESLSLSVLSRPSGWDAKVVGSVVVFSAQGADAAQGGEFRLSASPALGTGGEFALRMIKIEETERGRFGGVPLSPDSVGVTVAARSVLTVGSAAVSVTMRYVGGSDGLHVLASDGKYWDGYQDAVCAYRSGSADSAWRVPTMTELAGILTDGDAAQVEVHDGNCQARPEILGLGNGALTLSGGGALLLGASAASFADSYVLRRTEVRGSVPSRRVHLAVALSNPNGGSGLEAHDGLDYGRARIVCVADAGGSEGSSHLAEPRFYSEGVELIGSARANGSGDVLTLTVEARRRSRSGEAPSRGTALEVGSVVESGSGFSAEVRTVHPGVAEVKVRSADGFSGRLRLRAETPTGERRELEIILSP